MQIANRSPNHCEAQLGELPVDKEVTGQCAFVTRGDEPENSVEKEIHMTVVDASNATLITTSSSETVALRSSHIQDSSIEVKFGDIVATVAVRNFTDQLQDSLHEDNDGQLAVIVRDTSTMSATTTNRINKDSHETIDGAPISISSIKRKRADEDELETHATNELQHFFPISVPAANSATNNEVRIINKLW